MKIGEKTKTALKFAFVPAPLFAFRDGFESLKRIHKMAAEAKLRQEEAETLPLESVAADHLNRARWMLVSAAIAGIVGIINLPFHIPPGLIGLLVAYAFLSSARYHTFLYLVNIRGGSIPALAEIKKLGLYRWIPFAWEKSSPKVKQKIQKQKTPKGKA